MRVNDSYSQMKSCSSKTSLLAPQEHYFLSPKAPVDRVRDVRVLQLVFICFFLTAGGPFGLENCVASAGVAFTLLGLLLAPFVYAIPQFLMTSELSTMMPENGGYIVWVTRGCGTFVGWLNAWNGLLSNLFDNALYPVLAMDYYLRLHPGSLSQTMAMYVKRGVVVFGGVVNIFKVRHLGNLSAILALLVISPFIIAFCYEFQRVAPREQWLWNPPSKQSYDWALFFATLLWANTGWDTLGSMAGEVIDGQKTYIKTACICSVFNVLMYCCAIISTAAIPTEGIPKENIWADGFFLTAYYNEFAWLGSLTAVASATECISLYIIEISNTSRAWMKMADDGSGDLVDQNKLSMLPRIFNWEWSRTSSPIPAIFCQTVIVFFLVEFDFSFLVKMDMFASAVCYLLEFTAFLRLRYTESNAPRPFKVPGGMVAAWALTILKFTVMGSYLVLILQEWVPLLCIGVYNIIIVLLYILRITFGPERPVIPRNNVF